jgi:hypothetical protein
MGKAQEPSDSEPPYCGTQFPHTHTLIDLPYLEIWDLRTCFVLIYIYIYVDSLTSNQVSQKLVLIYTVHSSAHNVNLSWDKV